MNKKIPLRLCVGCKEMKPKKEMMRVIKSADGEIFLDTTGKKNGRGAYICKQVECLEKAFSNHGLERSLKISIPKETIENLSKEMKMFVEQQ